MCEKSVAKRCQIYVICVYAHVFIIYENPHTHIGFHEWAHPPAQRQQCVYRLNNRLFILKLSNSRCMLFSFPETDIKLAATLIFCCFWSVYTQTENSLVRSNERTHARTHTHTRRSDVCAFDGVTAFSFVIFVLCCVFKFSYHKPFLFHFFAHLCVHISVISDCLLIVYSQKEHDTKKLSSKLCNWTL